MAVRTPPSAKAVPAVSQPLQPQVAPHAVILVTAGYDHTIRFWEALSGVCTRTIQHPDSQVNRLAISPDKRALAAAGNPTVRLYDIPTGSPNPVATYEGHTNNVTAIQFAPSGKWFTTSSEDGYVRVWDVRSPKATREYFHGCYVNDVAVHPNQGEVLSCDQNGSIRIWDIAENQCTHELIPEETPLRSISIASDAGLLVAANNHGHCFVWKVSNSPSTGGFADLQPLTKLKAHEQYITTCRLSPDSKYLATCSADFSVKIWDTHLFKLNKVLNGHQRWVWDCVFSADSMYLVTASSDNSAKLWDLTQGEAIRNYSGHSKACVCVAMNDISM